MPGVVGDERGPRTRMLDDMGSARADRRTAAGARTQFCQGHSYRHSSTLFSQGFDAVRIEEDRTRLPHRGYEERERRFV
jgi:hypothetical protein